MMLTDMIPPSLLRSVTVSGYAGHVRALLAFLLKHKSSLRSLSLQSAVFSSLEEWQLLVSTLADTFELEELNLTYLAVIEGGLTLHIDEEYIGHVSKHGKEEITEFLYKLATQGHFKPIDRSGHGLSKSGPSGDLTSEGVSPLVVDGDFSNEDLSSEEG